MDKQKLVAGGLMAPDAAVLQVALTYAARGWPVLPLHSRREDGKCSCGSDSCRSPAKHPHTTNGVKDASTDSETIRSWWDKWPNANVGIATGEPSGLDVLDVDGEIGAANVARLCGEHEELPEGPTAKTGGGGAHYIFKHDSGLTVGRDVLGRESRVDLRGDGGYIVAAPSLHASGGCYSWETDPSACEIPEWPEWLLGIVRHKGREATTEIASVTTDLSVQAPTRDEAVPQAIQSAMRKLNRADEGLGDDPRPRIEIGSEITEMADALREALTSDPKVHVFRRAGALVEVADGDAGLEIVQASPARLDEIAATVASWWKSDSYGQLSPSLPSRRVVQAVFAHPTKKIPLLKAISYTPTLRPDGSILDTPGFDSASGIFYCKNADYPLIPATPSKEEALQARDVLLDALLDFPFLADSDRSAAVALILTCLARQAVDGPCPLFLIRSPTPGTGKSLLVDLASIIATGNDASRIPEADNESEDRKRLFALALEGPPVALLDNVIRPLGSAALAAFLTAKEFKDRVLGYSKMSSAPVTTVLAATGNNLTIRCDLHRRVIPIDLDAGIERPEDRTGFKHKDLLAWAKVERSQLVVAGLTILRHHFASEAKVELSAFGSYEAWSGIIRAALVGIGEEDPAAGRARIRDAADPEADAVAAALAAWHEAYKGRALAVSEAVMQANRTLKTALAALYRKSNPDKLDAALIGYVFRRFKDRPLGGLVLRAPGKTRSGVLWQVESLVEEGDGSDAGGVTVIESSEITF